MEVQTASLLGEITAGSLPCRNCRSRRPARTTSIVMWVTEACKNNLKRDLYVKVRLAKRAAEIKTPG